MKEYQSREFCRDTDCYKQTFIDKMSKEENKEEIKKSCEKCKAWQFHDWLQKNDYKIIKEG